MKKTIIEMVIIFIVFFTGTATLLMVDGICAETTGAGGKLVLDVDNHRFFQ